MVISNLREPGFAVDSPFLLSDERIGVWRFTSTHGDAPAFDNGAVTAMDLHGAEPVRITDEPGIYGAVKATCDASGTIRVVFTQTRNGERRVCLGSIRDSVALGVADVSGGFGKYDSPAIAARDGMIYVAWEVCDDEGFGIELKALRFADDSTSPEVVKATRVEAGPGARGYRPALTAGGDGCLYLVHESFYGGRYHVVAQAIPAGSEELSDAVEIGFGDGNDQAASICRFADGIAVAWENSKPLYKGYVYPPFPEITIPGFGHGWRIETKFGLCKVAYADGDWAVEEPGATPKVEIDAPESSGCPALTTDGDGRLLLAYLSYLGHPKWWKIVVAAHDGAAWKSVGEFDDASTRRITPGFAWDGSAGQPVVGTLNCAREGTEAVTAAVELNDTPRRDPFRRETGALRVYFRARKQERIAVERDGQALTAWWGDLHMHSNISPCSMHTGFHCTEVEEKYRFSRDVGDLDFALVADHDHMSDFDWARTRRAAECAHAPGVFLSFTGFEWTSSMMTDHENFGHRNVLYLDDDAPLLRCHVPESDTPDRLWACLEGRRAMTIPHHTSCAQHPFNWDYHNPAFESLVEIFQVRGSAEYDGCPMSPELYGREDVRGRSVAEGLRRGYRLGFTSGGEHEGVGVTAVYAEELTRESIFDALRARRTYGTTGARIALEFRVDDHLMGEEIPFRESPAVFMRAHGTAPIESIRLMRDGRPVREWRAFGPEVEIKWTDRGVEQGKHYYYMVIAQSDGQMAWSSPVFMG